MNVNNLKITAFTLIELMIVMLIVALLSGLVGPLVIQNIEKNQAKSELLSVKNWLKQVSYRAFIGGHDLELILEGKQLKLLEVGSAYLIKQQNFEYLFFQPQVLHFNNKGFVTPTIVNAFYREKAMTINLSQFINSEYVVQNES